jgi:hypothetical protein
VRSLIVLALLAHLSGFALASDPERRPPVAWSVGAGMGVALAGLAAGGGLLATAPAGEHPLKHAGFITIAGGLALAPIVSHLVAREWKRAIIFGIAPLALGAVAIGMLEAYPDLLDFGQLAPRLVFGTMLALQLLASGVGLVDSLYAGERARAARPPPVSVIPLLGPQHIGLAIGGTL